jgi:hypothetical protein
MGLLGGAVGGMYVYVTNYTIATLPPLTTASSTSSMFLDGA